MPTGKPLLYKMAPLKLDRSLPFLIYGVVIYSAYFYHLNILMRFIIGLYLVAICLSNWRSAARLGTVNKENLTLNLYAFVGNICVLLCDSMIGFRRFVDSDNTSIN